MGLLSFLGFGTHECVQAAQDNIDGEVTSAFYRYDRRGDEFEVGVIADGEYIPLYGYQTEGDADAAAGALARFYGVGIRG